MDLTTVGTVFKDIATGLLGIGVGLTVLTLAMGGIAMYFSWMDTHIGGLIKKILMSSLGGGAPLPPTDFPNVGRFAMLHDGQGAGFAVIKLAR